MKIVFFGSSDFSVPILEALADSEKLVLVVTQPDRKKGRSLKKESTPVKNTAEGLGIRVFQPDDVNSRDAVKYLKRFDAGLFIVVSFGEILGKEILHIPKLYSLNVHASLLPRYRGAAPVNWVIANGERKTGITVMKMNERIDEGEVILKEAVSVRDGEDAIGLSERLSKKAPGLLLASIDLIKQDKVIFRKQDSKDASYAPKLKKEDGLIDWKMPASSIYNRVRAFVPWPGCFTYFKGRLLKIWKAGITTEVPSRDLRPGTVIEATKDRILVSTGKGAIEIEELQLEGKRRMKAGEFLAGHREMVVGAHFTPTP